MYDFSVGEKANSNLFTRIFELSKLSQSQLSQEMFVLIHLDFKRDGFFVEFGATNGVDLSNTWLLETEFSWKGILAEPSRYWHHCLSKNRSCGIEKKAVWINSDQRLTFLESTSSGLSTINSFRYSDIHFRKGITYEVETISLLDLLIKYDAPKIIDYLSIDTEGSELEILTNFDFEKYKFRVITVEHNFMKNRKKINQLLISKGYKQVLKSISSFDDWYILDSI
jgi:FkbM family methyltransferase